MVGAISQMMTLIAYSSDKLVPGEYSKISLYQPWKEKYIEVAIKTIRVATEQEYLQFCAEQELPVRNNLLSLTHNYYEIEILD